MSNILDQILAAKSKAVERQKARKPLKALENEAVSAAARPSFLNAVSRDGKVSIIAEMKRQSPSAGNLTEKSGEYNPEAIAREYDAAGARALSILTEEDYFKGSLKDLEVATKATDLPILRKDFMIDPYQIFESKAAGASAVLLIVAALGADLYGELFRLACELKLDALVEVHTEKELEAALKENPDCVGINNRNLKTLQTDLRTTLDLLPKVPKGICVVSESGIREPSTIRELRDLGVRAALIGESILKSENRRQKLKSLVEAGNA